MRIVAELIGFVLIAASLIIGWLFIVKRWFEGPPKEESTDERNRS